MNPATNNRPPREVFEACARGLAERTRTGAGGTQASVEFAEFVTGGYPLEVAQLAEALEAHRLLDELINRNGIETRELKISRNLWGSDAGRDWAEAVIEMARARTGRPSQVVSPPAGGETTAPVSPLAAGLDLEPDWLTRLGERASRIDDRLRSDLEAAMEAAWATIRREAVRVADRNLKRMPAETAASLGDEGMNERDRILEGIRADPYRKFDAALPMCAMLGIDLDEAVQAALQDLAETADAAIERAHTHIRATVADQADVPADEVDAELVQDQADSRAAAAALLLAVFGKWAVGRLNRSNIDEGQQPPQADVSASIANDAAMAAGGAAVDGAGITRSAAGRPVSSEGETIHNAVSRWVKQSIEAQAAQAAAAHASGNTELAGRLAGRIPNGPDVVPLRLVFEKVWDYGDPATRIKPYRPHRVLDRVRWVTDDEADDSLNGQAVGDHIGCQCIVRTSPRWARVVARQAASVGA